MENLLQMFLAAYPAAIAGGIGGLLITWLTHRVMNVRGTFTYFVRHERIGAAGNDTVFGNVVVTWNGTATNNLFLSNITLKNESMNDYENVVIRAYTDQTQLLSEQTQVLDSPNTIEWTESFKQLLHVAEGGNPTPAQQNIYNGQREYRIPVMNRGQVVRVTYLNSPRPNIGKNAPAIFLSVTQKGVRLKQQSPQPQFFGVNQGHAALAGIIIGIFFLVVAVQCISDPWILAIASMSYGLSALIPGAYALKFATKIKETIGG